ncbi:hypothetical protein Taro_010451, partial [Colocasia esculenta]|nr:hypothetical protein [Colocasia esculenta]
DCWGCRSVVAYASTFGKLIGTINYSGRRGGSTIFHYHHLIKHGSQSFPPSGYSPGSLLAHLPLRGGCEGDGSGCKQGFEASGTPTWMPDPTSADQAAVAVAVEDLAAEVPVVAVGDLAAEVPVVAVADLVAVGAGDPVVVADLAVEGGLTVLLRATRPAATRK